MNRHPAFRRRTPWRGAIRPWVSLAAGVLAAGCEMAPQPDPLQPLPPLVIEGPATIDGLGATAAYRVNVSGILALQVQWSSSDSAVLEPAAPAGSFVSRTGGTAVVSAAVGSRRAERRVTVAAPAPPRTTLILAAQGDTLMTSLGDTLAIQALLQSPGWAPTPATDATWTSSDTAVARVAGGRVVAGANGRAVITARAGGAEGALAVRVSQVATELTVEAPDHPIPALGGSVRIAATARDRRGNPVAGVPMTWASSAPTRIRVDGTGLATSVAYGSATVTVRAIGLARTTRVHVRGGAAPVPEEVRAGITRIGADTVASYVIVSLNVRDPEADTDSVVVTLLDPAGTVVARHRKPIEQGATLVPLSLHAAAAGRATQARIETFDAAGNRGSRTETLRRSPNPQSPVVDTVQFRRVGSDSIHVSLAASDQGRDVDVIWLVGFDAAGGWTLIHEFVLEDASPPPQWLADLGLRGEAVARSVGFGLALADRGGNLSVLHLSAGATVGSNRVPGAPVPTLDRVPGTVASPTGAARVEGATPVRARPRPR